MTDEIVFSVQDSVAERAEPISLEEAGLREREHLQEWVVANPDVLGPDVMVVTTEFGRWVTSSGSTERDRLDVLGLGPDGRTVVAELKRGTAPDATEMQAIKYAALASRFEPELLAEAHAAFLKSRGEDVTEAEALNLLNDHCQFTLDAETLRSPRVVLLASSFPPVLTSTVVWLSEMGLDIALIQFQAYRMRDKIVVSVSRVYPVTDVEEFTLAPARRGSRSASATELPSVEWSSSDFVQFAQVVTNPTVLAALDLCSSSPGAPIPLRDVEAKADRTRHQARADLAGLTMMVKKRFGRKNWPFDFQWGGPGDPQQAHYSMNPDAAAHWLAASSDSSESET